MAPNNHHLSLQIVRSGYTRTVILIGRWALKIPAMRGLHTRVGIGAFIRGLKSNQQEAKFAKASWSELCPVHWSLPGGILLCMQRAIPLSDSDWDNFNYSEFVCREDSPGIMGDEQTERVARVTCNPALNLVPVERKRDSFGKIGDRVVAVDYGGFR